MEKTPLILASILITLQAIANLIRFFWDIPVIIGSLTLPGWTGAIFFIILGLLATWSFQAIYRSSNSP